MTQAVMNQVEHTAQREASKSPVVICVAPNGARRTKKDHASLPMTPEELAAEALACADAGASVIHLHVRADDGTHSLDVHRYRTAIEQIKLKTRDRLLIQVTTEAVGLYQPPQQMAVVKALRPHAASVAIRELVPDNTSRGQAIDFFHWCSTSDVALQFIVYTPEEAKTLQAMAQRGELGTDRPNTLFVLGRYTEGQRSSASDLLPYLAHWDVNNPWSVCAFGASESACMTTAIGLGGHVRVGFENNLTRADGATAQNNAELVANVAEIARRSGRGLGSIDQALLVFGARRV